MKKIALLALATGSVLAMAAPAAAQTVTGNVTITGSVAPKCFVLPGAGTTFGTPVGTPISLGELAQADGTMRTNLAASVNASAALSARVVCTSGAPTISVDANAITAATATAATGYDNSIDFEASVAVTTTGGSTNFTNDSAAGAGAVTPIGGRLANNGGNNIVITTSNFRTGALTDLLAADPVYTGTIVVVIAPN